MHYPYVKYYLINPIFGRQLLNFEPINWNDDEKTLVRNEDNWGVFTQLSNNLEFVKDGRRIIQEVFYTQGTEAELILERYVAETTSQGYELEYRGYLDLKTFAEQDEKVTIKFLTGGLQNLIESQFDEAYELERGTDINGSQITPLDFETIYWEGRRIFLESLNKTPEYTQGNPQTNQNAYIFSSLQGSQTVTIGYAVDLSTVYESDEIDFFEVFSREQVLMQNIPNNQANLPNANSIFFQNQTTENKTYNAKVKAKFNYKIISATGEGLDNVDKFLLVVGFAKYFFNSNDEYEWVQNIGLTSSNLNQLQSLSSIGLFNGESINTQIDLEPNEALVLTPYLVPITNDTSFLYLSIFNYDFEVKFEQDSFFAPTEFKGVKIWDAYNRMLEIYTGKKNKFKSDYFLTGEFKDLLLTSGKKIRNLPDAKIAIELKDLYEINNYFNLGWAVEIKNGIETFVVEPKKYFFQPTVAIDLGEVSDLEILSKEDLLFKSMTFGNKKAGDYEEVQGLQEYNALTTFVSHLKTSDTKYEVDANVRADLVGAELARRKDYSVAPNEDTRYDNENFLFNCKPYEITKWTPKVWQDVLISEPIVYDPPTAGNLLLTPFRSMQRHANVFNAGMKVYQDKFTRYSAGTGKVETQTQLTGEPLYAENSDIENSLLKPPIFEAIQYSFKKPLSLEIKKKLRGHTNVNGRNIPNVNFLVKFAYKGQRYLGYILEVSFNGEGEWKLIKSGQRITNAPFINV